MTVAPSFSTVHYQPSRAPIPAATLDALVSLINRAYHDSESHLYAGRRLDPYPPLATAAAQLLAEVGDGFTVCLFSSDGSFPEPRLVGTLSFKRLDPTHRLLSGFAGGEDEDARQEGGTLWELILVAVDPAAKQRGFGRRLLEEGERVLRQVAGERAVFVALVIVEVGLVPYYQRRGFVQVGKEKVCPKGMWESYGEFRLVRMEKRIA